MQQTCVYVEPYRPVVAVGQRPSSAQCRALWFPPVLTGTGHMQQLSGARGHSWAAERLLIWRLKMGFQLLPEVRNRLEDCTHPE